MKLIKGFLTAFYLVHAKVVLAGVLPLGPKTSRPSRHHVVALALKLLLQGHLIK